MTNEFDTPTANIQMDSASADFWHCQFLQCNNAISVTHTAYVHNVLLAHCANGLSSGTLAAEHITADGIDTLSLGSTQAVSLTNCILTAVTNIGFTPSLRHWPLTPVPPAGTLLKRKPKTIPPKKVPPLNGTAISSGVSTGNG